MKLTIRNWEKLNETPLAHGYRVGKVARNPHSYRIHLTHPQKRERVFILSRDGIVDESGEPFYSTTMEGSMGLGRVGHEFLRSPENLIAQINASF